MNATRTVGMLLFYKIDQMLFLGEGREIWARSVIDHEDGYVMNCFDRHCPEFCVNENRIQL